MVRTDSQIEPAPQEMNGEVLTTGTNRAADARLNIHARGFWELQGQWRIQAPPPYFSTKMRPKGPKKIVLETAPPPPYLKDWTRH